MIGAKKNGFTLMETLVALGLFAIVLTIATDLFLTFGRASRRTEELNTLVADARFVVEHIARDVQEGTIDYTAYPSPGPTGAQTTLAITAVDGTTHSFVYDGDTHSLLLQQGAGAGERLTAPTVQVRSAMFFISPDKNPFLYDKERGVFESDFQPRVTIVLGLENNVLPGSRDYVTYDVQTTISSRAYRR